MREITILRQPSLTIRAISSVPVAVPMTYALGTSRGTMTAAPLLLIDLETQEGITGHSYVWSYFPAVLPAIAKILEEIERVVQGERLAPLELWHRLAERFTLIGVQGIVRMAMAGFDIAAWDGLAQAAGVYTAANHNKIGDVLAAQSKPDFISKCSIAAKEARETRYWLRLLSAAASVRSSSGSATRR